MVQQTQQSLNSFIGLLGGLYQLPHPQTPEMPLASDPGQIARGMDRKLAQVSGAVYLPVYWRSVMAMIRIMPDAVIRRFGV